MSSRTRTAKLQLSQTKICRSCGKELPLSSFTKCHFSYLADCKTCAAARKRKRYSEDTEYRLKQKVASRRYNHKVYSTPEGRYKALIAAQNRRALGNLTVTQWFSILDTFNNSCAYCGATQDLEQEHIIPVSKGGRTCVGNIIPACRHCNSSKGSKDLLEWYCSVSYYNAHKLEHIINYMEKYT